MARKVSGSNEIARVFRKTILNPKCIFKVSCVYSADQNKPINVEKKTFYDKCELSGDTTHILASIQCFNSLKAFCTFSLTFFLFGWTFNDLPLKPGFHV